MYVPLRLFGLCVSILLLSACADPRAFSFSTVEQHYLTASNGVAYSGTRGGTTVRQSFMPTMDGLHRVAFTLGYGAGHGGTATVTLRDDDGRVVYESQLPLNELTPNSPQLLIFEPQADSALRAYTIHVTVGDQVEVLADEDDRYRGRLAVDGVYQEGDLLLEWGYKPTMKVLAHDVQSLVQKWGVPFGLNALLWTLPGLALLAWVRRGEIEPWSIPFLLGAAWAIGGALLVILPMAAWWVGLPLGAWAVWLLLALSALALVAAWRRGQPFRAIEPLGTLGWLYLALIGLVVVSRVLVIHPLNAPLWGDSVHHSLITQLLLDNRGIFETYEPYLPLAPFTYHAGFHLLCAWLGWSVLPGQAALTGMDATLLGGQWQNVMAVAMVGLLAEGLTRRAGRAPQAVMAGMLALLVAGLLTTMPAFYVNWGRYTQLAGQIFLPPALLWSYTSWHSQTRRRWLVITVLVVAALALTHYRVLILYAAALPLILWAVLWNEGWRLSAVRAVAARALTSGIATLLLILPWYWKLQESVIIQRTQAMLSTASQGSEYIAEYNAFGDITAYVPAWFLVAAAGSLAILLWRRHLAGWLIGGWIVASFVIANPQWLRLPGTGLVNNFMLQIGLYIPLALLVGCAAALLIARLPGSVRRNRLAVTVAASMLLALGVWGVWQQVGLAEVRWYSFLTAPDWRAARWIQANTPRDAVFHVNGFFAYYDTTVAGSDGGEWLPLVAGRETTVPPMIYAHEAGIDPGYRAEVNDRYRHLEGMERNPDNLAAAMRAEGVEYIYVGGQQGMIGAPVEDVPMEPLALAQSDAFETVYTDEFVWIFRVR